MAHGRGTCGRNGEGVGIAAHNWGRHLQALCVEISPAAAVRECADAAIVLARMDNASVRDMVQGDGRQCGCCGCCRPARPAEPLAGIVLHEAVFTLGDAK